MRRSKILIRLAVFAATALCLLVVAEVVVRSTYRPAPDLRDIVIWDQRGFEPPLNAAGFREHPLVAEDLAPSTTRILMLGDSYTFGQGVDDGADRFSDLIEARLEHERGQRVHVYNAGIPGSMPNDWVGYLEQLMPEYRPDLVLAIFFLRDGTALGTSLQFHLERIEALQAKYSFGGLARHSRLAAAIGDRLAVRDFSRWYLEQFELAYLGSPEQTQVWTEMQTRLAELSEICDRNGVPFQLVIFPLLFDLDDYPYAAVENEIQRGATANGIPVFSLTPAFLGCDARTLWISPSDQHPNERAHRIAAERLYAYIEAVLPEG